jgi:dTMP kinase
VSPLIAFEGPEGAGKTTQLARLDRRLSAMGQRVLSLAEPGGTELGEAVRSLLLGGGGQTSPVAELLLFGASRAELVAQRILPALAAGELVLLDRFTLSSRAYQGGGRGIPQIWLEQLEFWVAGGLRPDLTLLLDLPPEQGLARAARRQPLDRMEGQGLQFHARVARVYREAAAGDASVVLLDAAQPQEVVAERIWEQVTSRFQLP